MILNSFFQVCKSSVNLLTSMFVEIDLKFCFGVYSTGSEPSALGWLLAEVNNTHPEIRQKSPHIVHVMIYTSGKKATDVLDVIILDILQYIVYWTSHQTRVCM